jgi:hypothetical protein
MKISMTVFLLLILVSALVVALTMRGYWIIFPVAALGVFLRHLGNSTLNAFIVSLALLIGLSLGNIYHMKTPNIVIVCLSLFGVTGYLIDRFQNIRVEGK